MKQQRKKPRTQTRRPHAVILKFAPVSLKIHQPKRRKKE